MDTVSNIPFELKIIQHFPKYKEISAVNFSKSETDIWKDEFVSISAEENDEINILFNSDDSSARLYLEALDIIPLDDENVLEDENGKLYRTVSANSFVLYANNPKYDALRMDSFKISVFCEGEWYYGVFEILPKPITKSEWNIMKDDLEQEITGLAQDIVRRNIGIGNLKNGNIPPEIIYDFLIIKKYSSKVIMALVDIADNPRYEIKTEYTNVMLTNSEKYKFDAQTMRRYAIKSGSEPTLHVPVKMINYDIQDNRILKDILCEYEKILNIFIKLIIEAEAYTSLGNLGSSIQYRNSWNESLSEFKDTAYKLKKITLIVKSKEWYKMVNNQTDAYVSHSFVLDSRYNTLNQMHLELKRKSISIQLNHDFSYTWKRSSYLYEMWCYLKICHMFVDEYNITSDDWKFSITNKILFPFLKEGTKVEFEKDNFKIAIVYDQCLPLSRSNTNLDNPLYMAKHHSSYRNHNRPDIVIHTYDTSNSMYLGSIILECKYRKLNSFWSTNSHRSSRGQLEAYYNNARSSILFNGIGEQILQSRPVVKVFVLSPDDHVEGHEQKDYEIVAKTFKACNTNSYVKELWTEINESLEQIVSRYEKIKPILFSSTK